MEQIVFDLECILMCGHNSDNLQQILSSLEEKSSFSFQDYTEELSQIVKYVVQGEFIKVLRQPTAQLLLRNVSINEDFPVSLKENLQKFVNVQDPSAKIIRQLLVLCIGLACLKLFIQQNWLGPTLDKGQRDQLPSCLQQEKSDAVLLSHLSCETENIYELASLPAVFAVARSVLCHGYLNLCKTESVWAMRCLFCHQSLLEERSISLNTEIMNHVEKVKCLNDLKIPSSLVSELDLELSYVFLYYYEYNKAKEHLEKAKSKVGVEVHFTGALGKRTYFQQNDCSQLIVDVKVPKRNESDTVESFCNPNELPKDLLLGDDTVMPQIKFASEQKLPNLQTLEQAVIVSLGYAHMRSHALFSLTVEEMIAYIMCLLNQPTNWCIQTAALYLRSKLEKDKPRKIERSMMQLESLANQVGQEMPPVTLRMKFYHCTPVPPRWAIEKELANLLWRIGSVNGALEVFLRLEMWEEAIECYLEQGRYEKAENMIKEQLDINETPKLWCMLGDIKRDISLYEKAWELSEHRSARAQKSIGYFYLRAEKFEECIPHFQKSLALNPMQVYVWFSLGCAAMKSNHFTVATTALYKCVNLDPENGEAWNNLSSVLIATDKVPKAFHTLQEAIRADYHNWRIWENFLLVSIQVGEFEKAISAYHQMLQLKDKYTDLQILKVLVNVVTSDTLDNSGRKASRLKPKMEQLLGRITSCVTGNAYIWLLYHDLYNSGDSDEDKDKALQFLIKAHRIRSQSQECEKDASKCKDLIQLTLDLSKEYISASERRKSEAVQLLSSAKLSMKSLITKTKKHFTDIEGKVELTLVNPLGELESQLEHILTLTASARDASQ